MRFLSIVMGKVEEDSSIYSFSEHYLPWHGHVTALTVAPQYRRLGIAKLLTAAFEQACDNLSAWFVDLFVRAGNETAINLYQGMGYVLLNPVEERTPAECFCSYSVYRRVVDYYCDNPTAKTMGGEDAFDMRKPLKRDKKLKYIRENGENFRVNPEDLYHG